MKKKELMELLKDVPDDAEIQSYGDALQGVCYSFGQNVVAACEYHGGFKSGQKTATIIPANDCEHCTTWFDHFAPEEAHKIKEVEVF